MPRCELLQQATGHSPLALCRAVFFSHRFRIRRRTGTPIFCSSSKIVGSGGSRRIIAVQEGEMSVDAPGSGGEMGNKAGLKDPQQG